MFTHKPGSDTPKGVLDAIMRVKRNALTPPTPVPPVENRSAK